jgi:hypothetical protein
MQKQFYFLSPVEVVKVTLQNLQEVAEWCGGKVAATESRRVPGRMDSYVWVPTPKGTAISWAFPGMFITKRLVVTEKNEFRVTYAVFRKSYFEKNYFETPTAAVEQTWEKGNKKEKKAMAPLPESELLVRAPAEEASANTVINVYVQDDPEQAVKLVQEALGATEVVPGQAAQA